MNKNLILTSNISHAVPTATTEPRRINPSLIWALLGAAFISLELFVVWNWVSSDNFRPIPVDPGSVPQFTKDVIHVLEWVMPTITAFVVWKFLILQSIKERQLTTDGMLVITWLFLWFQDPMGNLITTQLLYSSYWFNMGSWTLGSMPGWISPNGNNLPEPVLVMGFGYLWLGFAGSVIACAGMRWVKNRYPRVSNLELALVALVICIFLNDTGEVLLMMAGTYAWSAVIEEITLFYGTSYQLPLTEGILFPAVLAASALLRYYKDDKGMTIVERGLHRLQIPSQARLMVKFLAIFGFMHLTMAVVYSIPMAWTSMYAAPSRTYPSHLVNNMCVSGIHNNQCPGPGIAMPRPPY